MNVIFCNLITERIVVVYLDNILIFTQTIKEHTWAIWRVLEILAEHKLFLHPEKCEFEKIWIKYLGLVISKNEVSMDPIKVTKVQVSQMATYWFVSWWFNNQKVQKSKV